MTVPRALVILSLSLSLSTILGSCAHEEISTQKAVEERLTCQCGCGLTVHTCNHLQCSFAVPVKGDIAASLAAGQSAEEILERYLTEYGEKILSSPTTEGFNLVAWYGPFIALILGALGIIAAARRWKRLATAANLADDVRLPPQTHQVGPGDRARLERELKEFDA